MSHFIKAIAESLLSFFTKKIWQWLKKSLGMEEDRPIIAPRFDDSVLKMVQMSETNENAKRILEDIDTDRLINVPPQTTFNGTVFLFGILVFAALFVMVGRFIEFTKPEYVKPAVKAILERGKSQ